MKLLLNDRREQTPSGYSAQEESDLAKQLDLLAWFSAKSTAPVYLTGGLSLSLLQGDFHRRHHDVDFIVFESDLPEFGKYADKLGYDFFTRTASIRLASKTLQLLMPTSSQDIIASRKRHLRLVHRADISGLRKNIDLFVYDTSNLDAPRFVQNYGGAKIPRDSFYPITAVPYGSGNFLIPNPAHLSYFKKPTDAASALDLQLIGQAKA